MINTNTYSLIEHSEDNSGTKVKRLTMAWMGVGIKYLYLDALQWSAKDNDLEFTVECNGRTVLTITGDSVTHHAKGENNAE